MGIEPHSSASYSRKHSSCTLPIGHGENVDCSSKSEKSDGVSFLGSRSAALRNVNPEMSSVPERKYGLTGKSAFTISGRDDLAICPANDHTYFRRLAGSIARSARPIPFE